MRRMDLDKILSNLSQTDSWRFWGWLLDDAICIRQKRGLLLIPTSRDLWIAREVSATRVILSPSWVGISLVTLPIDGTMYLTSTSTKGHRLSHHTISFLEYCDLLQVAVLKMEVDG